jgi:hypothetical protein
MTFLPRALSLIPTCLQQGKKVCCSSVARQISKRTFFASSTDHTRLLSDSQVFRLPQEDGILLYALAAGGSDADIVRKVPQLHLARLFVDSQQQHMWGAKVVNRTLGSLPKVCDKLVDAALQDLKRPVLAKSTLHGLSDWVLTVMDKKESSAMQSFDPETLEAVTAVARNQATAQYPKDAWEILAKDFLRHSSEGESALYQAKGATLVEIQHQVDTTEFSDTCAGAMALFEFK